MGFGLRLEVRVEGFRVQDFGVVFRQARSGVPCPGWDASQSSQVQRSLAPAV